MCSHIDFPLWPVISTDFNPGKYSIISPGPERTKAGENNPPFEVCTQPVFWLHAKCPLTFVNNITFDRMHVDERYLGQDTLLMLAKDQKQLAKFEG